MRETRKTDKEKQAASCSTVPYTPFKNTFTLIHSRKHEYFQVRVQAHSRPRTHHQSNLQIHNEWILVQKNFDNQTYKFTMNEYWSKNTSTRIARRIYNLYREMSKRSTLDPLPFLFPLLILSRNTVTTAPSLTPNQHHGEFGYHHLEESQSSSFFAPACSLPLPFPPDLTSKLPFFGFVVKRYFSEVICRFWIQLFEIFTSTS